MSAYELMEEHHVAETAALQQCVEAAEKPAPCIWKPQDDGAYWETACGRAFSFEDAGPVENEYLYCPGCGHPLLAKPIIEDIEMDEDNPVVAALAREEKPHE